MNENDQDEPGGPGTPPTATTGDETRYQVRVPVVFDHLNGDLRDELNRLKLSLLEALGSEAAIVEIGGVRFGKFEIWFEVQDASEPAGSRHAADEALGALAAALERIGLAPTGDERGLYVVDRQVVATPLVAPGERPPP